MLPFTTIPFIKGKSTQQTGSFNSDESDSEALGDQCTESTSNSSAAFYNSVISSEPSQSSQTVMKSERGKRPKTYKEITPSSYKVLYNHICNDDVMSVKHWFTRHIPNHSWGDADEYSSHMNNVAKCLSDEHGCNIAMTAAVYKSYESLKFLLQSLPTLVDEEDNLGNSFNDVVRNLHDDHLNSIVSKYSKRIESNEKNVVSTFQSEKYCKQCNMAHHDPDHETSISHLVAENRAIAEINPHLDPNNVGYKMMSKLGWSENKGLGPSEAGRKYLIKTQLKKDRRGLGIPEESKPKVSHFEPNDASSLQDNNAHKRKIRLKTDSKRKRKKDLEKSRQWEIDIRRSMNEYE